MTIARRYLVVTRIIGEEYETGELEMLDEKGKDRWQLAGVIGDGAKRTYYFSRLEGT